ncbi:MAG: hypothetical protein PHD70_11610, partial [Anaerostipes sp.]|nr:hypothetical protein [Anaerostipes sp.]
YKFKFIDPKEVFVDATHVKACANNKKLAKMIERMALLCLQSETSRYSYEYLLVFSFHES